MPPTVVDTASAVYVWLTTHNDAADIRAVVYGGANGIYEAGDFTRTALETAFKARSSAGQTSKALGIMVQDAGDGPLGPSPYMEYVVIRIFDLHNGYRVIRTVRDLIRKRLIALGEEGSTITDVDGEKRGMLSLRYIERTGYRQSREFAAEFESITFRGLLMLEEA